MADDNETPETEDAGEGQEDQPTEPTEINFSDLKGRITGINTPTVEDHDEQLDESRSEDEKEGPAVEEPVGPVYLQEEEPTGESNWIKWALMHGTREEEILDMGKNPNTVRICAQELERDGYRKRPQKLKSSKAVQTRDAGADRVDRQNSRAVKTFAHGSPPEMIIDSLRMPLAGREAEIYENGVKSGMSLLVLAVRVMQELATTGVQQAGSIIQMSKSMREGEAMAAKDAAGEAANNAAMKVGAMIGPVIESMTERVGDIEKKVAKPVSSNPMQDMFVRMMEPTFKQMMGMFMPGLAGPPQQNDSGIPGWTLESK